MNGRKLLVFEVWQTDDFRDWKRGEGSISDSMKHTYKNMHAYVVAVYPRGSIISLPLGFKDGRKPLL